MSTDDWSVFSKQLAPVWSAAVCRSSVGWALRSIGPNSGSTTLTDRSTGQRVETTRYRGPDRHAPRPRRPRCPSPMLWLSAACLVGRSTRCRMGRKSQSCFVGWQSSMGRPPSVDFCTWICTCHVFHCRVGRGRVSIRWPAREDLAVREGGPPPLLHGGAGRSPPERAPAITLIAIHPAPAPRFSVIVGG